jgi:hypothetical protein
MRPYRIAPALLACLLMAGAACYAAPRGLEARHLLAIKDDPAQIADRALEGHFDADTARREIESALAAHDADLAKSFLDLARDRGVTIDPSLAAQVDTAVTQSESTRHAMESFAMGFVTGEPNDGAGLAGTATGDLFVFVDIRDAVREGGRLALGQPADELVLGLAGVGLAITAGTMRRSAPPRRHARASRRLYRSRAAAGGGLEQAQGRAGRCLDR